MAEFEGRLTRRLYELGELSLPPTAVGDLELPDHLSDLTVALDGDEISCGWNPSTRTLFSETLRDEIQLQAQPGDLFKLTSDTGGLRLRFSHSLTSVLGDPSRATVIPEPDPTPRRRRRLSVERFRNRSNDEFVWRGAVGFHEPTINGFAENLAADGWDNRSLFELRIDGEKLAAVNTFDQLLALGMAKHVINSCQNVDTETGRIIERLGQSVLINSEDAREGNAAFREKRKPEFKGR